MCIYERSINFIYGGSTTSIYVHILYHISSVCAQLVCMCISFVYAHKQKIHIYMEVKLEYIIRLKLFSTFVYAHIWKVRIYRSYAYLSYMHNFCICVYPLYMWNFRICTCTKTKYIKKLCTTSIICIHNSPYICSTYLPAHIFHICRTFICVHILSICVSYIYSHIFRIYAYSKDMHIYLKHIYERYTYTEDICIYHVHVQLLYIRISSI